MLPTSGQQQQSSKNWREEIESKPLKADELKAIARQLGREPRQEEMTCVRLIAEFILDCGVLIHLMELADNQSQQAMQVAHGHEHAADVANLSLHLLARIEELTPGSVTELDRAVSKVTGALHDTGRVDIPLHATYSAIIADWYLRRVALLIAGMDCPDWFRKRVVSDCMRHQSAQILYKSEAEKEARQERNLLPAPCSLAHRR